jgi:hypothetical protein
LKGHDWNVIGSSLAGGKMKAASRYIVVIALVIVLSLPAIPGYNEYPDEYPEDYY